MENTRVSNIDWENDIYAKGQQLNNWPYTEVVSDIIRLTKGKDRTKLRILELGCGTCNNLWFAAELGFQVSGIDISKSAINYGESRLKKLGFSNLDLKVGDITKLDWEDNYFDIILDRGALTQNNYERIHETLDEVHRVLKNDSGMMLCYTLFGLRCTDINYGKKVSKNTYDFFTEGKFSKVGLTSFFTVEELEKLFHKFNYLDIKNTLIEDVKTKHQLETYSIICQK